MKHKLPKLIVASFALLLPFVGSAQPKFTEYEHDLSYFLPKTLQLGDVEHSLEGRYNSAIPTPKQVLGYELGERYCDWGDILRYVEALDKASDRIQMSVLGYTVEYRPLVQLVISTPANLAKLDQIKAAHLALSNPAQSSSLDTKQMPLVADITCSIHGNEITGAHAALAMAYLFAASEEAPVLEMLDKTVLLLHPGMNPDGINNFATWCNYSSSVMKNFDQASFEHKEPWPGNRGNHYYANLNRDLLMCQHPEGKASVEQYLDWLPNLVLDLHEKGGDTYFHSPGHPKRLHPYVTTENQALTGEVGKYVSKALTPLGAKPYSGKDFDDFYLGKGGAYGDVHGSVCLLFEQPNTKNYGKEVKNGVVTFPSGIRNHSYASLAALSAGYNMREKLLNYQREFYQKSAANAIENPIQGYIFHTNGDKGRAFRLLENLSVHQVDVYALAKDVKVGKEKYVAGEAYVIPLSSQQYYYKTKALWERIGMDEYKDDKFYDISTWTFPLAYNVVHNDLKSVDGLLGEKVELAFHTGEVVGGKSDVAYTFEATDLYSFNIIRALLLEGVNVKIARKPFKVDGRKMGYGSGVVEVANYDSEKLYNIVSKAAKEWGVDIYAVKKLNSEKLDLAAARMPKVALLVGTGRGDNIGEVWKLLDQQYGIAPTRISPESLASVSLSKYNVFIASAASLPKNHKGFEKIRKWVEAGGTLVLTGSSCSISNGAKLTQIKRLSNPAGKKVSENIKGAIVNSNLDITSPIGYGYCDSNMPLMKVSPAVYAEATTPNVIVPLRYSAEPYLSGYISPNNVSRIASTPAAFVAKCGNGRVIHFCTSPTFRSYWYGGNKMFMNAVYFGHLY